MLRKTISLAPAILAASKQYSSLSHQHEETSSPSLSTSSSNLRFSSRAVKCSQDPQYLRFQCPLDGNSLLLQASSSSPSSSAAVASSARVMLHRNNERSNTAQVHLIGPDATVVAIRGGRVFMRCAGRSVSVAKSADLGFDIEDGDVVAIISRLSKREEDDAIESLLCALSRHAEAEEAAESMLIDARGTHPDGAVAMVSYVHPASHACGGIQPPEFFDSEQ